MDFGLLFSRSWQLLWRHQFLWALGLLPGVIHVISTLLRYWLTNYVRLDLLPIITSVSPETLLYAEDLPFIQELLSEFLRGDVLVVGMFWMFLALVVFWLIYTLVEAATIAGTLSLKAGQPTTLKQTLVKGWSLLSKFIAIDALVFLPWFALALAAMVLGAIILVAATGMSMQGAAVESITGVLLVGFGCVTLLACGLWPLGFVTLQFRTLAFRDTAVFGHGVRESVRHTWQVVRGSLGAVIILVVIMWGVDYVFGLLTGLVTLPFSAVTAVSTISGSGTSSRLVDFAGLAVTLLLAVPKALLFVFIGIAWTLAYLDLTKKEDE